VARSRSKAGIASEQGSPKRFGKSYVRRIVGCQIVAKLPNARQKYEIRIARYSHIQQVLDCFIGTAGRDYRFAHKAP
jgi:hypothetical protein